MRPGIRCRPTIRSSAPDRRAPAPRSGPSACATRGGTASTTRVAAARGALLIGDVGQDRWEEIDYEPANRGGRNYGWRNREGAHDNVTSQPPAYLPLTEPIHEYDHSAGHRSPAGSCIAGARSARRTGDAISSATLNGRVWSIALSVDGSGEARASDLTEHTSELGGLARLGNISSFGIDSDGELYIVSYSNGTILKVTGPPSAHAPAPTASRIVR